MTGFLNPHMLWLLGLIPGLGYLYLRVLARKRKAAMGFSSLSFLKSAMGDSKLRRRDALMFGISLGVIALMIIGLANPFVELTNSRKGVNVILVMDTSGSMNAQDYKPTRLEAAKNAARILIEDLEPTDNIGIVTFATYASQEGCITPYKTAAEENLNRITRGSGSTAIGDGLNLGVEMASDIPNQKRVVILLSDGEHNTGDKTPEEAIQAAKDTSVQIYTVGLGDMTTKNERIAGYDHLGQPMYATVNRGLLYEVATQTDGKYFESVDEKTLNEIYKTISEDILRQPQEQSIKDWFYLAAMLLFALQLYMRYGGRRVIA